jgi:hypothetical protein
MLQRFVQVLQTDEKDDAMSDVVRRFWTRAKPLPARFEHCPVRPPARVVDLATWARNRSDADR